MNATINDVIIGIVTSGLAKYFKMKSFGEPTKPIRITGLAMVDIRETPGIREFFLKMRERKPEWGNRFGYVLLPLYLYLNDSHSLEYVKRAKAILDQKKQSLEANFSYHGGCLIMSLLGIKFATMLNYRMLCHTSFSLSNVIGPTERIMFAKNPIISIRVTSSSLPQALSCHLVSYNGKAALQLLVTREIIPEPETLAKCFTDSLTEMLSVHVTKISNQP